MGNFAENLNLGNRFRPPLIERDVVGTVLCGDCITAFTYSDC